MLRRRCRYARATYFFSHKNADKDIFRRDIEKESVIRRSTTSGFLTKTESKGVIKRTSADSDARLKKITLTEAALKNHGDMEKKAQALEDAIREGISDEEIETFLRIAEKIKQNIMKKL